MNFNANKYTNWYSLVKSYQIELSEDDAIDYYMRFNEDNYKQCLPTILDYFLPLEQRKKIIYAANTNTISALAECVDFSIGETTLLDTRIIFKNSILEDSSLVNILKYITFKKVKENINLSDEAVIVFKESVWNKVHGILARSATASELADIITDGYFLWNNDKAMQEVITDVLEPRLVSLTTIQHAITSGEVKYMTESTLKELGSTFEFTAFLNKFKTPLTNELIGISTCS